MFVVEKLERERVKKWGYRGRGKLKCTARAARDWWCKCCDVCIQEETFSWNHLLIISPLDRLRWEETKELSKHVTVVYKSNSHQDGWGESTVYVTLLIVLSVLRSPQRSFRYGFSQRSSAYCAIVTNKKQKLQELVGQLHGATTGAGVKITVQN